MAPTDLLRVLVHTLERLGIPYFITGSMASMAWGEYRLTNDIDVVTDLELVHVDPLVAAFPLPEYYLSADAARSAILRRSSFNILHPASGLKVDVIVQRATEFDVSRFARRKRIQAAPDFQADFSAPEDVILKKLEFYREGGSEKHLRDIGGVLKVTGDQVDRAYIERWADRLGVLDIWQAILHRMEP